MTSEEKVKLVWPQAIRNAKGVWSDREAMADFLGESWDQVSMFTRVISAAHVAETFDNAPFESDVSGTNINASEAALAKEVMLHAVTKYELKECRYMLDECREALKAAILLAECGEVPAPVTVEGWGKLL